VNMTPILFLDIDDVLCLSKPYGGFDVIGAIKGQHPDPDAVFREVFHPRACDVLKEVHDALDGQLRYVISSTWRRAFNREQIETIFRRTGLDFVAAQIHPAWATPYGFNARMRVEDIENWLDQHHRGEPFAIVDDTFSGPSLKPAVVNRGHRLHGRVVLCLESVGLTPEHVEPLVRALLNRPGLEALEGVE
jgi:hypothetical protein